MEENKTPQYNYEEDIGAQIVNIIDIKSAKHIEYRRAMHLSMSKFKYHTRQHLRTIHQDDITLVGCVYSLVTA